jgi:hypothetical protein
MQIAARKQNICEWNCGKDGSIPWIRTFFFLPAVASGATVALSRTRGSCFELLLTVSRP